MSTSDKDTLLAMGFDPARVEWALKATANRGLQPAMDHIIEHQSDSIPDPNASSANVGDQEDNTGADVEPKSIKCVECGKVFRNTALANYHAEKSGHDQFEESTDDIKPLTEEEKKARLEELRERMAEKKARMEEEDVKEKREAEAIRRKSGKEMSKIKADMRLKQAMKDAEQKRKDKIEEKRVMSATRALVEADKRARAEKAARAKMLRDGTLDLPLNDDDDPAAAAAASETTSSATTSTAGTVAGRDFKDTRLQIRMATGGQPYTTTLSSDSTLREVAEFLAGQTLSVDVDTVTFTQHFPRKVFSHEDFSLTLRELGLTPSAVLIAS